MVSPESEKIFSEVLGIFEEGKYDQIPYAVTLSWEIGHDILVILRSESLRVAGYASSPPNLHVDEDDLRGVFGKFLRVFEDVEYPQVVSVDLTGKDLDTINSAFMDFAQHDDSRIKKGMLQKLAQINTSYVNAGGIARQAYTRLTQNG